MGSTLLSGHPYHDIQSLMINMVSIVVRKVDIICNHITAVPICALIEVQSSIISQIINFCASFAEL